MFLKMRNWFQKEFDGNAIMRFSFEGEKYNSPYLSFSDYQDVTFGSNGKYIFFNSPYVQYLTKDEQAFYYDNKIKNLPLAVDLKTGEVTSLIEGFTYTPDIPNLLDYDIYIRDFAVSDDLSTVAIEVTRRITVGNSSATSTFAEKSQIFVNFGDGWELASSLDGSTLGDNSSYDPLVSANGSKVYFSSMASSLQPGSNGVYPPVSGKLSAALLFSISQVGGIGR